MRRKVVFGSGNLLHGFGVQIEGFVARFVTHFVLQKIGDLFFAKNPETVAHLVCKKIGDSGAYLDCEIWGRLLL